MPYRLDGNTEDRRLKSIQELRKERKENGRCIQCGAGPTPLNPITHKPYVLCGKEANNCRGGNNAASIRRNEKNKEKKNNGNPRGR